jgi:hypothetical protein
MSFEDKYEQENLTKYGDILLNIKIEGNFEKAQLFQYNENGSQRIIYDEIYSNGILEPFSDGIPLLHLGTYSIQGVINNKEINILSKYAFLNCNDRLLLSTKAPMARELARLGT